MPYGISLGTVILRRNMLIDFFPTVKLSARNENLEPYALVNLVIGIQ